MNQLASRNRPPASASAVDRLAPRGLPAERAPQIGTALPGLPALHALSTLFDLRETSRVDTSKLASLRGLSLPQLGRRHGEGRPLRRDLREVGVKALQQRFGVDLGQAARVRRAALSLFAQLAPQAGREQLGELSWSADLHEIGIAVSHHDHHRHAAYLLAHVDMAGFSPGQQRRVAQLVLGQRGGLRKSLELCSDPSRLAELLALRLAVLLCQPRVDPPVGLQVALTTLPKAHVLTLRWPASWLVEHLRAVHLLDKEAVCWAGLNEFEVSTGHLKEQSDPVF
jgi:exopolyphosphatase/guanosine-5'-triphosphate,3'-diphosphate pyrophosphatase